MSYQVSWRDSKGVKDYEEIECLAGVTQIFQDYNPSEMDLELYEHFHSYDDGFGEVNLKRIQEAATLVAEAFPQGVWRNKSAMYETIDTGVVTINQHHTPATIHCRVAPFRLFMETGESLPFFEEAIKHGGVMAAWIASHYHNYSHLYDRWEGVEGWHQSYFPGTAYSGRNITRRDNIRRVIALYPQHRHLLGRDSARIKDTYVIPYIEDSVVERRIVTQIEKCFANAVDPDPNIDMADTLEYYQTWHDTILRVCEEIKGEQK